ncbi:hypothetical protein [Victivallis sp. Marseille-Q1083]|uniref:hypothetical protein n=1 Tax=Victivallis sp. Marseille-Q1083 TaxID=2717288 RepID=UPI0015898C48|nr:hypothetical protein [Victivallis sp. Marseille-Q1083]
MAGRAVLAVCGGFVHQFGRNGMLFWGLVTLPGVCAAAGFALLGWRRRRPGCYVSLPKRPAAGSGSPE